MMLADAPRYTLDKKKKQLETVDDFNDFLKL